MAFDHLANLYITYRSLSGFTKMAECEYRIDENDYKFYINSCIGYGVDGLQQGLLYFNTVNIDEHTTDPEMVPMYVYNSQEGTIFKCVWDGSFEVHLPKGCQMVEASDESLPDSITAIKFTNFNGNISLIYADKYGHARFLLGGLQGKDSDVYFVQDNHASTDVIENIGARLTLCLDDTNYYVYIDHGFTSIATLNGSDIIQD